MSEGERRIVTVLFADAVGHTPIAEKLGEEELYGLMQGCFARMQEAVERFGGSVNQFTGDGVLALFGAPIAYEDSARRAVCAGLALQQSLNEYASEVKKKHPIQCAYRVGINTGPVVVGRISDNLDLEFAAIGDTVNLAARMETMAETGTVYLSENTYRAVKDYIECENLGPKEIKGKSQPVTVYRAIREKDVTSRLQVSMERGLTPYVGRDQEQSALQAFLDKARRGQGQVVLLSGEAGIGKSRTLLEFRQSIQGDVRWLGGQCVSFGENFPYVSVTDLVKNCFGIEDMDADADIIRKIDEGAASWPEAAQDSLPYLKFLLNVTSAPQDVVTMDPLERRAGFFEAFRAMVFSLAQNETLVIAIEDLHWVDEQSEEVLKMLVGIAGSQRVLLLLTARPGYGGMALSDHSYFNRIALSQLPHEDSSLLAESALGSTGLPRDLQQAISEKAEGNPFYIEEVVRTLVETGVLVQGEGSIRVVENPNAVVIPDTIHDVILSRIDRLDPQSREAMQLASVIGREFTVRLLTRISDLEDGLSDTLDELRSLELIYETGYLPELSYMFKHALTHDVAYSTLLTDRRKRLHRTVAAAIESLFEERLAEHYESLAYHYERAEEFDKALDYLVKSGEKAAAAYANEEASDFLGRALEICDALGEDYLEKAADIAHIRSASNDTVGNYNAAASDLNREIVFAKKTDDLYRHGIALATRAYIEWQAHKFDESEATAKEAIALAGEKYIGVRFAAMLTLWYNLDAGGRHQEVAPLIPELKRLAHETHEPQFKALWSSFQPLRLNWFAKYQEAIHEIEGAKEVFEISVVSKIMGHWTRGIALAGMGRYMDSLETLKDVLALTERLGNTFYHIRVLNTLGWVYAEIHNLDEAIEWNTLGIQAAQEADTLDSEVESNARLNLGDNLMYLGKLDEAEEQFQWVEIIARNPKPEDRMSIHNYSAHCYHSYGDLCFIRGDYERALGYAEDCLHIAELSSRPKNKVKALRLKGQALTASNQFEEAEQALLHAITIAEEIGNPPQLWKTYKAQADLCEKTDDGSRRESALRAAKKVLFDMADGLDGPAREILLASSPVQEILEATK